MSSSLRNRTVLITGASQGIGRNEALYFAKLGASVVINDIPKKQKKLNQLADELIEIGASVCVAAYDISCSKGAQSCFNAAIEKFSKVDVLINNAGILRDSSFLKMQEEDWDAVIKVHLKGSFLMSQVFAKTLTKNSETTSAIINTSSMSGLRGNFGQANYSAAKAGIFGLTKTLAIELARFNCRVNAIAPVALTAMTQDLALFQDPTMAAMKSAHVAPVVAWLADDISAAINGQVFGVHGQHIFEYSMQQSAGVSKPPIECSEWTPESLQASYADIKF